MATRDGQMNPALPLPFLTLDVAPDQQAQDRLDAKAKHILDAIDAGKPPHCLCGYCRW